MKLVVSIVLILLQAGLHLFVFFIQQNQIFYDTAEFDLVHFRL